METSDAVLAALKPGDMTSEHAAMLHSRLYGYVTGALGVLVMLWPQVAPYIMASSFATTPTGQLALTIVGGLITFASQSGISASATTYITGRSQLKAATVLNTVQPAPIAPANVPPAL